MSFWEIIVIAIVLGIDAASVALVIGARGCTLRQNCRLSFHFGLFQFIMPIAGWLLGRSVVSYVETFDHWVAFGLLMGIGIKMLYEAFKHHAEDAPQCDRTKGWNLIALSVATSIDALAVGVGMGISKTSLIYPSAIIGITAATMTFTGAKLGNMLSSIVGTVGSRMEAFGGIVLIGLGIKILITGLASTPLQI